ncbi:MAG: hypothetical protein ACE3NC_05590 [Candidatus Wallacebacter cryptica]|jgi:ElaB/YqjD/DUF883 family membrane-anchored ribosome-binding protein|nr:hypothetical protein [Bacillota bacterium]
MRIRLEHPRYKLLTSTGEGLVLHGDKTVPLYPNQVEDCAVTVSKNNIHVAALLKNNTILHWFGDSELLSQEIMTEAQPIRSLKMVTDSDGTPHLFYLQENLKQTGCVLIQHTFAAGRWGDSVRVTSNISGDPQHWQIANGSDRQLHLVYADQPLETLFYRLGDMKNKSWSGAIPLVQEPADSPQIYDSNRALIIVWISSLEQGKILKAVLREEYWSKPCELSPITKDVFQPGIDISHDVPAVVWMQSSKLWRARYEQEWSDPELLDMDVYESTYQAVSADAEDNCGCAVMRVYVRRQEELQSVAEEKPPGDAQTPAPTPEPDPQPKPEPSPAEQARKEAERRFFAQAFQLHQEWQSVKEQYARILDVKAELAEEIEKSLTAKAEQLLEQKLREQSEELSLLVQRVQTLREEVRSLKARFGTQRPNAEFNTLKERIEKIESSLRAKISETQLREIKSRIAELEAQNSAKAAQSESKPLKSRPKRNLIQKILSRI